MNPQSSNQDIVNNFYHPNLSQISSNPSSSISSIGSTMSQSDKVPSNPSQFHPKRSKKRKNRKKLPKSYQSKHDPFNLNDIQFELDQPLRQERFILKKIEKKTVFNHEAFVHSNFRFIVSSNLPFSSNPDHPLDWVDILWVLHITSLEIETQCVICLSPFTFPTMTHCGHIFCLPCLFHHIITLPDHQLPSCPICLIQPILTQSFRPVRMISVPNYTLNDTIELKLLFRKGIAIASNPTKLNHNQSTIPLWEEYHQHPYHRIFTSHDPSTSIDLDEITQMNQMNQMITKGSLADFETKMAIKLAKEWINIYKDNISKDYRIEKAKNDTKNDTKEEESNIHQFYQSSDGQLIFLHPLLNKWIQLEFQHGHSSPSLIQSRINWIEYVEQSLSSRENYPELAHIPLRCSYKVISIQATQEMFQDPNNGKGFEKEYQEIKMMGGGG